MDSNFDIFQLENKFFINAKKHTTKVDLPKIAEKIYLSKDDRIIDINATDSEILIISDKMNKSEIAKIIHKMSDSTINEKTASNTLIRIPVCYVLGQDWSTVESEIGLQREHYIDLLTKLEFRLAMFGFIPGFCYLDGLPPSMQCKRKSNYSAKIRSNTLALGGKYVGIYGLDSPGGWLDIGKVARSFVNIPADPPHKLDFNTKIQFYPINENEYHQIKIS